MILTRLTSDLWSTVNGLMRTVYDVGWFKRSKLPCRVISVGNLQAGGSGKTPLVAHLAREAVVRGGSVCILTRGYGGEWSRKSIGGVIAPGAERVNPVLSGDEAALLHLLVPEAWIGVGADRMGAYFAVEKRVGSRLGLVILDDGFQQFGLDRDVDILAVTSSSRARRLYRDFDSWVARASLVVWTKGERPALLDQARLSCHVRLAHRPPQLATDYWLVTGVGDPGHVRESLTEAGYSIVRHISGRDHVRYSLDQLKSWATAASAAGTRLLTTGKDWVKWEALGFTQGEWVEPTVEWIEGREAWEKALWEL